MKRFKVINGGKSSFDSELLKMCKELKRAYEIYLRDEIDSEILRFTLISTAAQLSDNTNVPFEEAMTIAKKELSEIADKLRQQRLNFRK